jgi:chromosome segregation ATPase
MDLFETLGEHIASTEQSKLDLNNNIDQKIAFIEHDVAQLQANFNALRLALVETTAKFTDLSDELQFKFRRVCELFDRHSDVFKINNLKDEYEKSIRRPESFR